MNRVSEAFNIYLDEFYTQFCELHTFSPTDLPNLIQSGVVSAEDEWFGGGIWPPASTQNP